MNDRRRVEAALARNLKDWRSKRGWSQAELARLAGLSKGMLVQIELPRLVELDDEPEVRRVAAADIAWLWHGRTKASAAGLIAGIDAPVPVELWDWRIGPRDGYDALAHPPGTREIVHVLEGAVTVTVAGVEVSLGAGEGAVFRADRPHRYASAGGRAARFVMVVVEPIPALAAPRRRPSVRPDAAPPARRVPARGTTRRAAGARPR
jgi:transcriptional regulator with XRE-family HTH domain